MQKQDNKKTGMQFIACAQCEGAGKTGVGSVCKNCSGAGVIAFCQGRFFYWDMLLTAPAVKLRHLKRALNLIVNLSGFTAGLIGIACLAYWVWNASQNTAMLGAFYFWRAKSPLILIFWISLIADMFVVYRLSIEEAAKRKIQKLKYGSTGKYNFPDNWLEFNKAKNQCKIEVASGFSAAAIKVVEQSFVLADYASHGKIKPIHLFFNLLKDRGAAAIFSRLNADSAKLVSKLKDQLLALPVEKGPVETPPEIKEIFFEAYAGAMDSNQRKVEPMHFILPILSRDKNISELLYDLEIDNDKISNAIQWLVINRKLMDNYRLYRKASRFKPSGAMNRAYTAVATPILNHFAYDLTLAAKYGRLELCVGREDEIKEIFQILESGKTGVLLCGHPGAGKNSIIGQIARQMVEEDVPDILKDKRLLELDISRLLSGISAEKAEERLLVIMDEAARAGNIVLHFNNIENLMGITAGGEQSLEVSEVLAGAVNRNDLVCFACATKENYAKYIENKPLGNAMAKIDIEEPDINSVIQILESKVGFYEAKFKIYFTYASIAKIAELSLKYIYDGYMPSKAVDILEIVSVKVSEKSGLNSIVGIEDVAEAISKKTKIPLTKITEKESEVLLNLENKMHERMIGQKEAVDMVAASLRRARAELREQKRPIASFLFLGPTGVGKTELAKTVAEVYFGNEDYMIRLDMSEYQRQEAVEKMIGSHDGTPGYLTEAARKAPFSLILLDEFEKAHPDILNLFLQVMDDGRLTDGSGRTINFTNCIIIATSNIGAVYIQDQIKAKISLDEIKQSLINDQLNKYLKPELINRFDGVVVFKPLALDEVESVAKLMLGKVKRLLEAKGIGFQCHEQGIKKLASMGFDPKFGARPLRRLIQDKIENKIADKVLAGELQRRDTVFINSEAETEVRKRKEL